MADCAAVEVGKKSVYIYPILKMSLDEAAPFSTTCRLFFGIHHKLMVCCDLGRCLQYGSTRLRRD
jgi:hypothetical protein